MIRQLDKSKVRKRLYELMDEAKNTKTLNNFIKNNARYGFARSLLVSILQGEFDMCASMCNCAKCTIENAEPLKLKKAKLDFELGKLYRHENGDKMLCYKIIKHHQNEDSVWFMNVDNPKYRTNSHRIVGEWKDPVVHEVWVNLYKDYKGRIKTGEVTYPTKFAAQKAALSHMIGQAEITFEEQQ
jgi:hypothetical protein